MKSSLHRGAGEPMKSQRNGMCSLLESRASKLQRRHSNRLIIRDMRRKDGLSSGKELGLGKSISYCMVGLTTVVLSPMGRAIMVLK
jgi:hypothetical protein